MSVTFGFYNSIHGDRKYNTTQISSIFDGIIRDGVFQHVGKALMVEASQFMTIYVGIGRAWFNHTWTLNDAILPLSVPISEVILNRIDAVIIEVDSRDNVRENSIKIVKGTPATNPVKPTMIKTTNRWQYPLAYIRVNAGVSSIRQADITNTVGTSETPFVTAPLEKMSIDALVSQWGEQWKAFYDKETADMNATNAFWKQQWVEWFNHYISSSDKEMSEWSDQSQANFNNWFDSIQGTLSGDIVVNFTNELLRLKTDYYICSLTGIREYYTSWKLYENIGGISAPLEDWGFTNATIKEVSSRVEIDINNNTQELFSTVEFGNRIWDVNNYAKGVYLLTADDKSLVLVRR